MLTRWSLKNRVYLFIYLLLLFFKFKLQAFADVFLYDVFHGSNMVSHNGHIPLFGKICMDLPLFAKYLAIYHLFEIRVCKTRVCRVTRVLELEFFEKITFKFAVLFFMKLEYHEKLDFPKLEFPISGRSLHISKTVVDYKILSKIVVFGQHDSS